MKISERILELLKEITCRQDVTLDTPLEDLDSLDLIDFVMQVEEEFEISIPDDEVSKMGSIKAFIDYVTEHGNVSG